MALLETPLHPFHLAVGKGVANQLEFLVANAGELLGDAHHRTVEFTHNPAVAVGAEFRHVALVAAQVDQAFEPLLEAALANPVAIVAGFLESLVFQQVLNQLWRQAAGHRLQQAEGEMLTAIGELPLAFAGEMPAVAWPAGPLGGWARLHQAVLFQAAQMAAHRLY